MRTYFEKLKTETSWIKLFIPIFIGMSIMLVVLTPAIDYVIQVFIKNNEYEGHNIGYAICVSLIYSAIIAKVVSYNHKKNNQK